MVALSNKKNKENDPPGSDSLLLGVSAKQKAKKIGFHTTATGAVNNTEEGHNFIEHTDDSHLITVAPTRSGKGTGVVIPNMLHYRGPIIVTDPRGEIYDVTHRWREQIGPVIKLDPFQVYDDHSHSLSPMDVFALPRADVEGESQAMADLYSKGTTGFREPFWDVSGCGVLSGVIGYAGGHEEVDKRTMVTVLEKLFNDDVVYTLAQLLDAEGKKMNKMSYRDIAAFLQMPDVTRGGVLATFQSYLKPYLNSRVMRTLGPSSFPLMDVVNGKPMTIYMMVPPDKLHSHRSLLKLWTGTLLKAITSRRHRPKLRTLFLLDEVAQMENFPLLEMMVTLSAGYGTWIWMILQDLDQLKSHYPTSWKTMLNNCGVIQTFGINNLSQATQWGEYLQTGPQQLMSLRREEQILARSCQADLRCQRINYLTDPFFKGKFDDNRLFTPPPEPPTKPGKGKSKRDADNNLPEPPSSPN